MSLKILEAATNSAKQASTLIQALNARIEEYKAAQPTKEQLEKVASQLVAANLIPSTSAEEAVRTMANPKLAVEMLGNLATLTKEAAESDVKPVGRPVPSDTTIPQDEFAQNVAAAVASRGKK